MEFIQSIRRIVGTEELLVPSNAVLATNAAGHLLLQLRSNVPLWGLPGGIMDIGESALDSARRELREETGLDAGDMTFFGLYSGPQYRTTYPNGDRLAIVQLVFLTTVGEEDPVADHESEDLRYFPVDRLPGSINPHHHQPLCDYIDYLRGARRLPVIS